MEVHGDGPEIGPDEISGLDDHGAARGDLPGPLHIHRRMEPGGHTQLLNLLPEPPLNILRGGDAGVMTALENAWEMMAWTVSSRSRYAGIISGSRWAMNSTASRGSRFTLPTYFGPESPLKSLPLPGSQARRRRPSSHRCSRRWREGSSILHHLPEEPPLLIPHQLGLILPGGGSGGAVGLEDPTLTPTSQGRPLQLLSRTPVIEARRWTAAGPRRSWVP